jgi:type I restriction enzyme R subunit
MSRRICVDLYNAIIARKPEWRDVVKVVMTGSASDGPDWQQHIRTKQLRRDLATEFKKPSSEFKNVIVRDMWLTGFDAPCLTTMYIDKPMQGHGLMQAIARVNRVFRDKPGGLVVDYLGLADSLKRALATYTQSGGRGAAKYRYTQAFAVLQEKHDVLCAMLHGYDWSAWNHAEPKTTRPSSPTIDFIYEQQDGAAALAWRLLTDISRAFRIVFVAA